MPAIKWCCVFLADADGIGVASTPLLPISILLLPVVRLKPALAQGNVVVARRIVAERIKTDCRVVAAGCVAVERFKTVGRITVAGCVAKERIVTSGRVGAAGCVDIERAKPWAALSFPVEFL